MAKSELEAQMEFQLKAVNAPPWEREYMFAKDIGRRWRADFCWNEPYKVILAIQGGTWGVSRHTTGTGYRGDAEKYSTAAALGYRVVFATSDMVKDGTALDLVERALGVT